MKPQIIALAVGILVALGALALIISGLIWQKETPWSFGLSLSTEVVGAFLTLISIEVFRWLWIARQEDQQKLPAKRMLCARLMHKIDEFLVSVLPTDQYKVTESVYIARGKSYRVMSVPILGQVSKQWSTELEQSIQDRAYFDRDLLTRADSWLSDIIGHADTMSEPELKRHLVRLQGELKESISSLKTVDWKEEGSRTAFVKSLQETVSATLVVRDKVHRVLEQHFDVIDESSLATL